MNASEALRRAAAGRVTLGCWPTPIDTVVPRSGPPLLVKRDDLSGFGRGGAKTRKLEHLLGYALARGHDELITVTGNVTNLVFDLLPAADRLALRSTILVADYPRVAPAEREVIFAGVRDRITLLGTNPAVAAVRALVAYAASRRRGGRPLLVLPGASHPASILGNAVGFLEMTDQLEASGEPLPHTVHVAVATGTTLAGFLLAAHALRAAGRAAIDVVGASVDIGWARAATRALVRWAERAWRLPHPVPTGAVRVVPLPRGHAFGRCDGPLADLCARVADDVGVRLDPIFGARAWAAMNAAAAPPRRDGRHAMFWHCGYTPEWTTLTAAVGRGAVRA